MENEIFENNPEVEVPVEQPVEIPVEQPVAEAPAADKKFDFAEMASSVGDKAKDLIANRGKFIDKIKAIPKKIWIMAGAGIAAIVAVIVLISILTNTYKTPISIMQEQDNLKSYKNQFQLVRESLNGLAKSELKTIEKIYKKTDAYKDNIDDMKENFKDSIEEAKDEYGKNYKYTYKVTEKEKIEKEDLKEMRESLRSIADRYDNLKEKTDDWGSDEWGDLADELEVSKSDAKKLVKAALSIGKLCRRAKVSAGYELTVTRTLKGSELDEPIEEERTIRVYKIDGRWVSSDALYALSLFTSLA